MGEILLIIVVVFVAVVAFAVWLCARVIGLIVRAIAGPARPSQVAMPHADLVQCPQLRCRAPNVSHARFCHRCGRAVAAAASCSAPTRYVA